MNTQTKPSVLFVCVHNAGRSQMAAGYLRHLAGDRIEVRSAGSMPADQINPTAVAAMREEGIDITAEQPKVLTPDSPMWLQSSSFPGGGDVTDFWARLSLRPLLSCMFHYGQSLRPVGLDGHGIAMPGGDVECVSRTAHS